MAQTRKAGWIELTAAGDTIAEAVRVNLITFDPTGGVAAEVAVGIKADVFARAQADPAVNTDVVVWRGSQAQTMSNLRLVTLGGTLAGILKVFTA